MVLLLIIPLVGGSGPPWAKEEPAADAKVGVFEAVVIGVVFVVVTVLGVLTFPGVIGVEEEVSEEEEEEEAEE